MKNKETRATSAPNPSAIESIGQKNQPAYDTSKEIDIKQHAIYDEHLRPRKKVKKDGQTRLVDPARLPFSLQDIIVTRRVAFMNLGKVKLYAEPNTTEEERAFSLLHRLRENNKLSYKESEVANILHRELQAAKLWYSTDTDDASHWGGYSSVKKDFKVRLLAPSKGDSLLPVFDSMGDLIYFARGYEVSKLDVTLASGEAGMTSGNDEKVRHLDVYSRDRLYRFQENAEAGGGTKGNWILTETVELPYGKIPVIYYSRELPIWANVQPLIERLEVVISNLADTNDYHASPTLVFKNVEDAKAQDKGENGKAILMKGEHADAKYVTWEQTVESVELEIDTLTNAIYSLTQTPNISFEEMKSLGDLSGVAFDRVFIDAHLASRREIEGGYGELIQRDINLQKALLASMDTSLSGALQSLSVTFEAPHFKLEDLDADVDLAGKAYSSGLISQETAVGMTGLVTDAQEELERIREEAKAGTRQKEDEQ